MIQQINLYNPAFEKKREYLSLPGALAAWGIALLLVAGTTMYAEIRASALSARLEQEGRARAAAQADVTRLGAQLAARNRDPAVDAELKRLEAELVSRQEVMTTLRSGVIGNTDGFAEHLRAFARQSFEGLWLTGLSVSSAGRSVVLEGRALQPELVPNYLQRLNRENVMRGQIFSQLEMRRPEGKPGDKGLSVPPFIEFRVSTPLVSGKADSVSAAR